MARKSTGIALVYRISFLYIEPFFAFLGAYYAFFLPEAYLQMTHASTAPHDGIPTSTKIVLTQLSNLYLLFAINEALVLRATSDLRVWRALVVGLLIADVGHLYSVSPLGVKVYWDVKSWNAIQWGNIPFVYANALLRVLFLISPAGLPEWPTIFSRKAQNTPRRSTRRPKRKTGD